MYVSETMRDVRLGSLGRNTMLAKRKKSNFCDEKPSESGIRIGIATVELENSSNIAGGASDTASSSSSLWSEVLRSFATIVSEVPGTVKRRSRLGEGGVISASKAVQYDRPSVESSTWITLWLVVI